MQFYYTNYWDKTSIFIEIKTTQTTPTEQYINFVHIYINAERKYVGKSIYNYC